MLKGRKALGHERPKKIGIERESSKINSLSQYAENDKLKVVKLIYSGEKNG
jgi:hypothetical protein